MWRWRLDLIYNIDHILVTLVGPRLFIMSLLCIILLLAAIAFYTLAERKIMASIQRRKGPNVVGIWGFLQPIADGFKLIIKQKITPKLATALIFSVAPCLIIVLSIVAWTVITFIVPSSLRPWSLYFLNRDWLSTLNFVRVPDFYWLKLHRKFIDLGGIGFYFFKVSLLFLLAISSLNVYSIILAGWSSNSKYAFFGALRSAAQMISYEVAIGLCILPIVLLTGNSLSILGFSLRYVLLEQQWLCFFLLPSFIVFFISILAETNRTPFDLTEAEAELVAGYNVEYSSIVFAMFFLAEYSNMLLMSALLVIFFFGANLLLFVIIQVLIIAFLFILIRATLPRYKYNELMDLGWKVFLPLMLAFCFYCGWFIVLLDAQPLQIWLLV
jgi:NADH-quinone oxidoreductase subunit H